MNQTKIKDWNYFFQQAQRYFRESNAITDPYDLSVLMETAYQQGVEDSSGNEELE